MLTAADRAQARIIDLRPQLGRNRNSHIGARLGSQENSRVAHCSIDSISKPGEENSTIPPNVAKAVNFYQSHGLLHGRTAILAMDPLHTDIVGNFKMSYKDHPINCDDFPWFAAVFTKPHIEIENDPRVWTEVASLIDSELAGAR